MGRAGGNDREGNVVKFIRGACMCHVKSTLSTNCSKPHTSTKTEITANAAQLSHAEKGYLSRTSLNSGHWESKPITDIMSGKEKFSNGQM